MTGKKSFYIKDCKFDVMTDIWEISVFATKDEWWTLFWGLPY